MRTTRVFCILSLTTTPSRVLRSPRSPTGLTLLGLGHTRAGGLSPLAQNGLGPGQILLGLVYPGRALGNPHGDLKSQIEDLLAQLSRLLRDLFVAEIAPLGRLHRAPPTTPRATNFVAIPIFCPAVRKASRASPAGTPSIS